MAGETPRTLDYSMGVERLRDDGRLDAPAFHRNKDAIASVLIEAGQGRPANLLEIACGTGQHASYIARMWPEVIWWPTDLMDSHLVSAAAWAAAGRVGNVMAPVALDVCARAWTSGTALDGLPETFDIVFAANMIHIADWQVTLDLFAGAAPRLRPGGAVILYGPFMRGGRHTADSNARFDESLKARNPAWGVRDLDDIERVAAGHGLFLREDIAMPANNGCVVFRAN